MLERLLPGPLVSGQWLNSNRQWVDIADVRWSMDTGPKIQDFANGRIPGAVFVDLDADLSAQPGPGGRHPLPSISDFLVALADKGLGSRPIVCYDDVGGGIAARLWWMLDVLGFPSAVLDGGVGAWPAELEKGEAVYSSRAADVWPQEVAEHQSWPTEALASADDVLASVATSAIPILDARPADRFAGRPNPIDQRPGHMPGAISRPWQTNLTDEFLFRAPEELLSQFDELGLEGDPSWIATCGSGVTACHNLLAARIAGIDDGKLYAGSWSEWTQDSDRPVATALSED